MIDLRLFFFQEYFLIAELFIKANGLTDNVMGRENKNGQMVLYTLVIENTINAKDLAD